MKRLIKGVLSLLLGWFLFTFVFGVLIFNVPITAQSDITYDVDAMMAPSDSVKGTYATVVDDNTFALDSRLAIIEKAQETIDIAYYTIHDGFSRDVFFQALFEAAERDVEVRIIIDRIFYAQTFRDQDRLNALASHENVTFKFYEPYNPFKPYTIQNRLHDKLMIIDGSYGMSGGRNIGDRFFMPNVGGGYSSTYDRDVLIHSEDGAHPTVEAMHAYFDVLFNHAYATPHEPDLKQDHTEARTEIKTAFETYKDDYDYSMDATFDAIDEKKVSVENATFLHGPISRMHKDPVVFETLGAIADKSDNWFIQSPYIVFSNIMKESMPDPTDKDITVLTNNMVTNTNVMAVSGYRRYRDEMAEVATLYEFQGDMTIHAKTMTFGNDISVIGSFNVDPRSATLSTESAIVVVSEDFKDALHGIVDEYIADSLVVTNDGVYAPHDSVEAVDMSRRREWMLRFLSGLTYFFDPML